MDVSEKLRKKRLLKMFWQ